MALCKNHDYIYFDTLRRVNKAETVLSLIMASYHVKSDTEEERKTEIAQNLVYAYNLFLGKAGTYTGTLDQFASQYTIGHELGIWTNSKLELNKYALEVARNKITIREYFDRVFLNYFQPINNVIFHPLYHILTYLIDNNKDFITKEEITDYVTNITKTTIAHEKKLEGTNSLYNMLLATSYFVANDSNDTLIYNSRYKKEFLREKCDISYISKGYQTAVLELKELEDYVDYLIHEKFVKEPKEGDKYMPETKPFTELNYKPLNKNSKIKSYNRIIFGAPGTGKSFQLKNESQPEGIPSPFETIERVTFHPDYSYGQFVGSYKPVSDDNGNINYIYVPGPFMRTLVAALESGKNGTSAKKYLLIIEEINRAKVAAVFGDMFQLLDRTDDGDSVYEIQASEDVRRYLARELGGTKDNYTSIKLPNNMYIWATMNSADQGVFPMDTAFKRRWEFTYLGINDNDKKISIEDLPVKNGENSTIKWNTLRKSINTMLLKECKVNEDKLLGPFFISGDVFHDATNKSDEFFDAFNSKVLMYLFEDAGKMHQKKLFAGIDQSELTFSKVCEEFKTRGTDIFGNAFQLVN